jgi:hypothetical protein
MELKTIRAPSPRINLILDEHIKRLKESGLYGNSKAEVVKWLLSDAIREKILSGELKPISYADHHIKDCD